MNANIFALAQLAALNLGRGASTAAADDEKRLRALMYLDSLGFTRGTDSEEADQYPANFDTALELITVGMKLQEADTEAARQLARAVTHPAPKATRSHDGGGDTFDRHGYRLVHVEDPSFEDAHIRSQAARGITMSQLTSGWYVGNFQPDVPFLIGPFGTSEQAAQQVSDDPMYPSETIFFVPMAADSGPRLSDEEAIASSPLATGQQPHRSA